jgi:Dolichyl-phosphate-mannose-protein mannosyltransferase
LYARKRVKLAVRLCVGRLLVCPFLLSESLAVYEGPGYSFSMRSVSRDVASSRPGEIAAPPSELRGSILQVESSGFLVLVLGFGLAIRLYLSLTSYCISGDGVAYLTMAHHFAVAQWRAGLGAVYSPLYPAFVSLMHTGVADWEIAGNLVSAVFGTAAIATTYLMTREVFGREVGLGAAVLIAFHPQTAGYSASVRTEAGYFFWTTGACWLVLKSLNERRLSLAACGGLASGLAYLYRTEAIGFLPLGIVLFLAAGWLWNQASHRWVLTATCVFAGVFMLVAAPYIAYLRIATGHWSIGREFNAAMMYGIGDAAQNGDEWRRIGWSANASPLRAIFEHPRLYADKRGQYLVESVYNSIQALEPLLTAMLAIGIWARTRSLFPRGSARRSVDLASPKRASAGTQIESTPTESKDEMAGGCVKSASARNQSHLSEVFLATIVLFYFCGFTLSYTGTRFMVHLIPFVAGWVAIGIIVVSEQSAQWCRRYSRTAISAIVWAIALITLLPRTLWPNGYDMRGLRYAGEDIAEMTRAPVAVAARDGRVAYYAGARLIELPSLPPADLCRWLHSEHTDFLMMGEHDERLFNVARSLSCLQLLKRYPRYGSGYYDLYAVRLLSEQDGRPARPVQLRSN